MGRILHLPWNEGFCGRHDAGYRHGYKTRTRFTNILGMGALFKKIARRKLYTKIII